MLNVLFALNVCFISCSIFNNLSYFFYFNLGYFFRTSSQSCSRRISIFNKISALDMFSSFCYASTSCFVIGIGLKREDSFLLINTSIIKFCRACFAKYVKFFNSLLNSWCSPRLWQTVLAFIGLVNPKLLKWIQNLWHSIVDSGQVFSPDV